MADGRAESDPASPDPLAPAMEADDASRRDMGTIDGTISLNPVKETSLSMSAAVAVDNVIASLLNVPVTNEVNLILHKGVGFNLETSAQEQSQAYQDKLLSVEAEGWTPVERDLPGVMALADEQKLQEERSRCPFVNFYPSRFKYPQLRPQDQIPVQEKLVDLRLVGQVQPQSITFIWMDNLASVLQPRARQTLGATMSQFVNVEVLGLRNAGLSRIDNFKLPRLLFCDLSNNKIANVNTVVGFVKNCPILEALTLTRNPLCASRDWHRELPEPQSEAWKIVVASMRLKTINGRPIAPEAYYAAVQRLGKKDTKARVAHTLFDFAFHERLPQIHQMREWQPSTIQELNLSDQKLFTVDLGVLVNLQVVNLAQNFLSSLDGMGLEQLVCLHTLNLHANRFSNKKQLSVFKFMLSLQALTFHTNPLPDYRPLIIFHTRRIRGMDHNPGLMQLDGRVVTLEEKVDSMVDGGHKKELPLQKWELAQVQRFGTRCLTDDEARSKLRLAVFAGLGLSSTQVGHFPGLELLDLRNNNLTVIQGLQSLQNLKVLLVNNNPLKLTPFFASLTEGRISTLLNVSCAPDIAKVSLRHRELVLRHLLSFNKALRVVENTEISVEERVLAIGRVQQLSRAEVEAYRYNLAITSSAATSSIRSFAPDDVLAGMQYDTLQVKELLSLSNLGLTSAICNFSMFLFLEKLNLSHNKLTNLASIGLEALQHLKQLDLRSNQLKLEAIAIAAFLDAVPSLEAVALKGNPCMKSDADRLQVISLVQRLREVQCSLRILDTVITVHERVDGWRKQGGDEDDCENLRFQVAMWWNAPQNVPPAQVSGLSLEDMGLRSHHASGNPVFNLVPFTNLRVLRLRNNNLTSVVHIGLAAMRLLTSLDLRDNRLTELEPVAQLVNAQLLQLQYIGLNGNKFAGTTGKEERKYRLKFVSLVNRLNQIGCPLRYLDDTEIAEDEIVKSWVGPTVEQLEQFRFQLVVHRKVPLVSERELLEELDLSNRRLSFIDLSMFPNLKRLALNHNLITVSRLAESNIETLPFLVGLDLTHNDMDNLKRLGSILNDMPSLSTLFIEQNKCFERDSPETRQKLFNSISSSAQSGWSLHTLNGKDITVEERVKSLESIVDSKVLEEIRLALTLEHINADEDMVDIRLRSMNLSFVGHLDRFVNIEKLFLSDNRLTTLAGQYLHALPHLRVLDIRKNSFESIDSIVLELQGCHRLKELFMLNAMRSNQTRHPSMYLHRVVDRLRGLEKVDGLPNPKPLNEEEKDAADFLHRLGGVSRNHLLDIDLSNKGLKKSHLALTIAALAVLPVQTLKADGNPWQNDTYRFYIIEGVDQLKTLDGIEIGQDEKLNAIAFMEKERKKKKIEEGAQKWSKVRDQGWGVAEKQAAKFGGRSTLKAGTGAGSAVGGASRSAATGTGVLQMDAIANIIKIPIVAVTGAILTKFEIVIGFLQIYATVLTFEIPWPDIFFDYSSWVYALNVDVDVYFSLRVPNLAYFKFIGMCCIPLLLLLAFVGARSFDHRSWINRYVRRWSGTKCRVLCWWLASVLLVLAVALFIDFNNNIESIKALRIPSDTPAGIVVVGVGGLTAVVLIWYLVVRNFRNNYHSKSYGAFYQWWLQRNRFIQRACLFCITIAYMPMVRFVLYNFAPIYPTSSDNEAKGGNQVKCSEGLSCCLKAFPDTLCLDANFELMPIHFLAFACIVVFVLGIPCFFIYLIQQGVGMVDIHGFKENMAALEADLAAYKEDMKGKTGKELKEMKKEYKRRDRNVSNYYAAQVAKNPVAQTYLYAAYERKWRFYKVFVMFEKLALICILLFVRADTLKEAKLLAASSVVGGFTLAALLSRPFMDGVEDFMDVVARIANTVNAFVGTGLSLAWDGFSPTMGNTVLLAVNLGLIILLVLFLISNPIRAWLANRRLKAEEARLALAPKQEEKDVDINHDVFSDEFEPLPGAVVRADSMLVKGDISTGLAAMDSAAEKQKAIENTEASEIQEEDEEEEPVNDYDDESDEGDDEDIDATGAIGAALMPPSPPKYDIAAVTDVTLSSRSSESADGFFSARQDLSPRPTDVAAAVNPYAAED